MCIRDRISATFLEMRDGTVKVSLRSRPGYDVARIARALGGGGHRNAAGFQITVSLGEATEVVLRELMCIIENKRRGQKQVNKT